MWRSPAPSPRLISSLQGVLYVPIAEENRLLYGSQACSPRSLKVDGQHAGSVFSSPSPHWHNGISTLPAPLLSGLSHSFPLILLGKVGKAKSWHLPMIQTPLCTEAVPNKSHRSMETEADPSTSTPRLEEPCLPLLYSWKHLPQSTSHLSTQQEVSSEGRGQQRIRPVTFCFFHPAKSFKLVCIEQSTALSRAPLSDLNTSDFSIKLTGLRVLFLKYIF